MNASNRPLATYASARAAEPMLRDTRIALRVARTRPATSTPGQRERGDEVLQALLVPHDDRSTVQRRRAARGRREGLVPHGVVDDADRWLAVDEQRDRDAEELHIVRVVHRCRRAGSMTQWGPRA